MKKKQLNILTLILIPFVIIGLTYVIKNRHINTVRAFGELSVDVGVPEGEPVFEIENLLPGDCISRTISIANDGDEVTTVSVKSNQEEDSQNLSQALDISILESDTLLYSNTLSQFFIDSDGVDGVVLSSIPSSSVKKFEYKICFHENAGNEFQEKKVVFDLIFGEVI